MNPERPHADNGSEFRLPKIETPSTDESAPRAAEGGAVLTQTEQLQALLLTPEQERTATSLKELRTRAPNGAELLVHGVRHTTSPDEMRPVVDSFRSENPDIVLVESGNALEDVYPGMSLEQILQMDPDQVLREKGEQTYMSFLAKREGKDVRTWDIGPVDQIRDVLALKKPESGEPKYQPQDVTAWIATYAARMSQTQFTSPLSADGVRKIADMAMTARGVRQLEELGIALDDASIDQAIQRETGQTLEQLAANLADPVVGKATLKALIEMTEPSHKRIDQPDGGAEYVPRSTPSNILRDMNIARDRHAIALFEELKTNEPQKKLFVTTGGSHVVTWKPALEKLYAE